MGAEHHKTALVLSGGGARGAYEVGIIRYLREGLPEKIRKRVKFDILCGTSVGAVNACFLAATAAQGERQGRALAEIWGGIEMSRLFDFGWWDLIRLPWFLMGKYAPSHKKKGLTKFGGLLKTDGLERLVFGAVDWRNIRRNLDSGLLDALSVSATDIGTGKTIVFIERREPGLPPWSVKPFVEPRRVSIGPLHALGSAAIPVLFPTVKVDDRWCSDGSLRQNTPLMPALRLGASKVMMIGLRHVREQTQTHVEDQRLASLHTPGYVLGKMFNALLLDRLDYDLAVLRRFNRLLENGRTAYGGDFVERLNQEVTKLRGAPYRYVQTQLIRPSRDIAEIASRYAAKQSVRARFRGPLGFLLDRISAGSGESEADLLSYLLFDQSYARELMALGWDDAAAHAIELEEFFCAPFRDF